MGAREGLGGGRGVIGSCLLDLDRAYWIVLIWCGSCVLDRADWFVPAGLPPSPPLTPPYPSPSWLAFTPHPLLAYIDIRRYPWTSIHGHP